MMSGRGLYAIVALPSGAKPLLRAAPHGVAVGVRVDVDVSGRQCQCVCESIQARGVVCGGVCVRVVVRAANVNQLCRNM